MAVWSNEPTDPVVDAKRAMDQIERAYELVKELPPLPWRIMASHSVPWPKTYRQWRSDGRLLLWVNRGAIHDLPVRDSADDKPPVLLYDSFMEVVPISIPVEFV